MKAEKGEIGESGFPVGTIQDRMYYNGLGCHICGVWLEEGRELVPLDQCVERGLMTQAEHDEIVENERKRGYGEIDTGESHLDDAEERAIRNNTGSCCRRINMALATVMEADMDDLERIVQLDSAFSKSGLKEPVELYSGIFMKNFEGLDLEAIAGSDRALMIKAYMSVSTDPPMAKMFFEKDKPNRIMARIWTPAGRGHAMAIGELATYFEHEMLLNRSRTYRVVEYRPKANDDDEGLLILEMIG